MPTVGIKLGLEQRRPMEQALIELQERYKRAPTKTLARMIAQLEAEIAERAESKVVAMNRPRPSAADASI